MTTESRAVRIFFPSYDDPKATIAQICVNIKDYRDVCLLITAIFGLMALQTLTVGVIWWEDSDFSQAENFNESPIFTADYTQRPSGTLQPWEKSDEEIGLMAVARRHEPLEDLRELTLRHSHKGMSEERLRSMLEHCHNIADINLPTTTVRDWDAKRLAQDIAHACPKLTRLLHAVFSGSFEVCRLLIYILEALPPQQVKEIDYTAMVTFWIANLDDGTAGSLFLSHSRININCWENFDSRAIQAILVKCGALERLTVKISNRPGDRGTELEDAIEFPWASTRIRELQLGISIPDEPLHHLANGMMPYYN
ncbi:hypothetical protein BG015_004725 [Linnemannia schmuckeri]|uniref:Uncharacterized protein n=1 Tax=Linnemannia schmuckeri TaxID=64567 RepID=A0A9P5VF11_9FUNG|nr:hypothetical protein BG015_004725 [Linnemannia schmuckeri]